MNKKSRKFEEGPEEEDTQNFPKSKTWCWSKRNITRNDTEEKENAKTSQSYIKVITKSC